jgi:hypothetical protein
MSFTRFHDDPCRIKKDLQESTGPGRYMLNQPGYGDKPLFFEDPHIRLQQWGGNLRTNTINIESDLKGMTRNLNRDCKQFKNNEVSSSVVSYPTLAASTEESRTTHPSWLLKDLETNRWDPLFFNPQNNTSIPFANNISSRNQEKDNFVFDLSHTPK